MMPSMNINQRRAELERERNAHVKAEQERIALETAHQRRIAELELEIAQAEEEERKARFGEAVQEHKTVLVRNEQAVKELRDALPQIVSDLLKSLDTTVTPAKESYDVLDKAAERAVRIGLQGVDARDQRDVNDPRQTTTQWQLEFTEYNRQLPAGTSSWIVFAEAIAQEKDARRKRTLEALCWLMWGSWDEDARHVPTWAEGFNAASAAERQTQQDRQRYSGQRILYG